MVVLASHGGAGRHRMGVRVRNSMPVRFSSPPDIFCFLLLSQLGHHVVALVVHHVGDVVLRLVRPPFHL